MKLTPRSLRALGIGIILLPDPTLITDVLGLMLVGSSYLLFRGKEADSQKQLKKLVESYLSYMNSGDFASTPVYHIPKKKGMTVEPIVRTVSRATSHQNSPVRPISSEIPEMVPATRRCFPGQFREKQPVRQTVRSTAKPRSHSSTSLHT